MALKINTPRVVHETIDSEVIAIDFESGSYYSISGTGSIIWSYLEKGASPDRLINWTAEHYRVAPEEIYNSVSEFLTILKEAELIASTDEAETTSYEPPHAENTKPFEVPTVTKFTDMQQLLLLDPIHEVDEVGGWPHKKI